MVQNWRLKNSSGQLGQNTYLIISQTITMEVIVLKLVGFVATLLMLSQSYANHFGMAGCGLGSLVFQDQPGKIQIVASTLNDIVSPQTSAITSGTSGCYEEQGSSASLNYIETNMVSLKEDAARGQGETIEGLMTLLGCSQSSAVKSEIKNNYQNIFNSNSASSILNAIQNNSVVRSSCGSVG